MKPLSIAFNGLLPRSDLMPHYSSHFPDGDYPTELLGALQRMGLAIPGERPPVTRLEGGVSSSIYRVDLGDGPVCVKRALPRLRVSADWQAPVERNHYEAEWLRLARAIVGEGVPEVLGEDEDDAVFAMEFLEPQRHPVWKTLLRDGVIAASSAGEVGRMIGRIHAATANNLALAGRFATDDIFQAIRLEPYLLATARVHADCSAPLLRLAERTAHNRIALVHGDVSPKNILIGLRGPVLLDAECAWYGDPAFDIAFCLTHLLLKTLWRPQWRDAYLASFDALAASYLQRVTWEMPEELEARTAELLPGLLLARIDGKSPVEYLESAADKDRVRKVAKQLLLEPVAKLAAVRETWAGFTAP
jgi:5-methylthioribose kinase